MSKSIPLALAVFLAAIPAATQTADEPACIPASVAEQVLACPAQETGDSSLDASATAACYESNPEELAAIRFLQARHHYDADRLVEAAAIFRHVATEHSDSEVAVPAANLYLDCLNALGSTVERPNPSCLDDLAAAVGAFADETQPPGSHLLRDEEFREQIRQLRINVLWRKAETYSKQGRLVDAADVYLTIERDHPDGYRSRDMCEVLYNAAINLELARLAGQAIAVRKRLLELYPNCEQAKTALYFVAQAYQALQLHQQAADRYLEFARKYPAEREAPDALENAITLLLALGQEERALETVELYERYYARKRPQEVATVVFSAGYLHVEDEDWNAVRRHYERYLKSYSRVRLLDEQLQAHVFIGDSYRLQKRPASKKALEHYEKAAALFDWAALDRVAEHPRKAALLIAASKARWFLAEREYDEFLSIELPKFAARKKNAEKHYERWLHHEFKPWLERKSDALYETTKLFAEVGDLHVPEWEMAAATRAADMQLHLYDELGSAPIPPKVAGDEQLEKLFSKTLDETREPYRRGAIGGYQHCLRISVAVRWFNRDSQRCEAALNDLLPDEYPLADEIMPTVDRDLSFIDAPGAILEREQKPDYGTGEPHVLENIESLEPLAGIEQLALPAAE